jgi:hypothetical protein
MAIAAQTRRYEWTGPLRTAQRFAERRRTGTQRGQQRLLVPGRLRRRRPDHAAQLLNSAGCGKARRDAGWGRSQVLARRRSQPREVAAAAGPGTHYMSRGEAGHQGCYRAGLPTSRLCSSMVSLSISRVSWVLVLSSSSCSVKS